MHRLSDYDASLVSEILQEGLRRGDSYSLEDAQEDIQTWQEDAATGPEDEEPVVPFDASGENKQKSTNTMS